MSPRGIFELFQLFSSHSSQPGNNGSPNASLKSPKARTNYGWFSDILLFRQKYNCRTERLRIRTTRRRRPSAARSFMRAAIVSSRPRANTYLHAFIQDPILFKSPLPLIYNCYCLSVLVFLPTLSCILPFARNNKKRHFIELFTDSPSLRLLRRNLAGRKQRIETSTAL